MRTKGDSVPRHVRGLFVAHYKAVYRGQSSTLVEELLEIHRPVISPWLVKYKKWILFKLLDSARYSGLDLKDYALEMQPSVGAEGYEN